MTGETATTNNIRPDWAQGHGRLWQASLTGTLTFAMGCATLASGIFSTLGPLFVADFTLSKTQLGLLLSGFSGAGAIGSTVAGSVADDIGAKRSLQVIFVVTAFSTVLVAAAQSYWLLMTASVIAGVGNALVNPATNKVVADHVARSRRGLVVGIKQSGVQLKFFLVGFLLPLGAVHLGWRWTLLVAAGLALAGVPLAAFIVKERRPGRVVEASGDGEGAPDPDVSRKSLLDRSSWLTTYAFLMGIGGGALVGYLPLYAHERLDFSVAASGAVVGVVGLIGAIARVAWGHFSVRLRHFGTPLAVIAVVAALSTAMILVSPDVGPWLLWLGAVATAVSVTAWNSVGMLAAIDLGGSESSGRISGFVVAGFLSGFTIGPFLFGYSVDLFGDYGIGWGVVVGCFTAAAVVSWRERLASRHRWKPARVGLQFGAHGRNPDAAE